MVAASVRQPENVAERSAVPTNPVREQRPDHREAARHYLIHISLRSLWTAELAGLRTLIQTDRIDTCRPRSWIRCLRHDRVTRDAPTSASHRATARVARVAAGQSC